MVEFLSLWNTSFLTEPRYIMIFQKEVGLTEFNNQASNDWQRTHITITHICMTATNPACLGGIRREGKVGYGRSAKSIELIEIKFFFLAL